jgi:hypothetical protein
MAAATVVIAFANIGYDYFARLQWQIQEGQLTALNESNRINNSALVEVQRASVLYNGFAVSQFNGGFTNLTKPDQSVIGEGIALAPTWFNAGGSATKNLRIFFGEPIESVTPIERPDMRIPPDTKYTPIVIGPKGSQNGIQRAISMEKLKRLKTGQYHIYLWGDAYYNDVFPNTKEHVTKFCQEIGGATFVLNTETKSEDLLSAIFVPCMVHNCIDDECKAQQ